MRYDIYIYFIRRLKVKLCTYRDRDSSVGIATRYGQDGPAIETWWAAIFSTPVQTDSGAHPTSYAMGTGSFPVTKQPRSDVDHPPLSNT